MASNSFGDFFRFTSWGESHGKAIGCVIDGVPPLIELSAGDIQGYLDLRKPGQSKYTTQRQEEDKVEILSGVFEGKTTGTPISLIIYNQDQRSKDYSEIKDKFRPGHADYTYHHKYGIRDYRGGGRSSARETAMRVAAGAVARKILGNKVTISAALVKMGNLAANKAEWDDSQIISNPFFLPDLNRLTEFEEYLAKVRKNGSSVGATIEIRINGVDVGLGDPIYDKLDAKLASAMMSINAVKSVEIGTGAEVSAMSGEENADEIDFTNNKVVFNNNNAGGILGGISSGQEIRLRFTVKPTSSILTPRKTLDINNQPTTIITKGRHDPCVGIRAVPVASAMAACVIADSMLKQKALKF
ncbi:MAG: chorismate synthase [Alphaproteobacteria bacterium]|nr:chorismate synthase [Alphaproteobacteria bacterium]